jgi:hypothetical protein
VSTTLALSLIVGLSTGCGAGEQPDTAAPVAPAEETAAEPVANDSFSDTSSTSNGWRNLVRRESGGGMLPSYVPYTFDGTTYVEGERLDADAMPGGEFVLAGEYSYATGLPLPPAN